MVGFVIWVVGFVLTIKAALEIGRLYADACPDFAKGWGKWQVCS